MTSKGKARRNKRLIKFAERRWAQRTLRYLQREYGSKRIRSTSACKWFLHEHDEGIQGFAWPASDDGVYVLDTFYRPGPWRYVPPTPAEDDPFEAAQ